MIFDAAFEKYKDNLLAEDENGLTVRYNDVIPFSEKLFAGLEKKTLIFIICSNTIGSLLGYLSALYRGIVPLLIPESINKDRLKELIDTYAPACIYAPETFACAFSENVAAVEAAAGTENAADAGKDEAAAAVDSGKADRVGNAVCAGDGAAAEVTSGTGAAVVCEDAAASRNYGYRMHFLTYKDGSGPVSAEELNPDLALLLMTSGSTGSPKLVRQTAANISANAESIAEYLELSESERPVTVLPMNYTYGLSVINSHVISGACIIMTTRNILERAFWEQVMAKKVTSLVGVPFTYKMLERVEFRSMELPALRYMTQAGGRLPEELQERYAQYAAERHIRFYIMYGQTEATARMAYLPPDKCLEKRGSIGIAIPGGCFSIEDDDGSAVTEPGMSGELVYRGANVTMGYAVCRADLKLGDDWHGVLHTGDMARTDEDGFYYITGRKKRFIKLFGNRVSLDEMEKLFAARFAEAGIDFACTGSDDHLKLYTDSKLPDTEDLMTDYFVEVTGFTPKAIEVIALDSIPRNDAGKIIYAAL